MMIELTHIDELDRAWKDKSSEEVTSLLYFHLTISWSSFVADC